MPTKPTLSAVISSPLGKLSIYVDQEKLVSLHFSKPNTPLKNPKTEFTKKVVQELRKYFKNPKQKFSIELEAVGTTLQKRIWQELLKIPVGTTVTYSLLAKKLSTGPRVIGNACRNNPIPIIVPCHRIVAINGIGGYSGKKSGVILERKIWLLKHETAK